MDIFVEIHSKPALKKSIVKSIINDFSEIKAQKFASMEVSFVPVDVISELNDDYLNHNYATDILTFDYKSEEPGAVEGEIIICSDVAVSNAAEYKVTVENELVRLVIHGLLHLTGYDDKTPEEKSEMKQEEDRLVELIYP